MDDFKEDFITCLCYFSRLPSMSLWLRVWVSFGGLACTTTLSPEKVIYCWITDELEELPSC